MLRALVVVGLALAVAAPGLAKKGPQVKLAQIAPAKVLGSGFHAGETVRVSFAAPGIHKMRRVTATSAGRISSIYPGVSVDICASWKVTAIGDLGSRATVRSKTHSCGSPPPFE